MIWLCQAGDSLGAGGSTVEWKGQEKHGRHSVELLPLATFKVPIAWIKYGGVCWSSGWRVVMGKSYSVKPVEEREVGLPSSWS